VCVYVAEEKRGQAGKKLSHHRGHTEEVRDLQGTEVQPMTFRKASH